MKNKLLLFLLIFLLIVIVKYFYSDYKIEYKVNNYNIKTIYKNKRLYYEISNNNRKYNFDVYQSRKISKQLVKSIETIKGDDIECVYPSIKNIKTYPLCYKNEEYVDYHLIDSDLINEYKPKIYYPDKNDKNFYYNNNLDSNEYVALWNYKGYIVMNKENYKIIDLFDKDKYDNSLAYIIDNKIIMPNNNQEYEYNSLIVFNIKSQKKEKIELKYNIDYDSYIVGSIDNNLYIFDNKYSVLYEVNIKNEKVNIIGNNEKGFVKYVNGEFIDCSKSEYKINKIKFEVTDNSNYEYKIDNGLYKTIKENNKIKQKLLNEKVNIIKTNESIIYYQYEDYFYKYDPRNGSKEIFYNYELNFNNNNTIFIYID